MAQELKTSIEVDMKPKFITKELSGNEPARCVDGRPSPESPQGPQMLGGSILPIIIEAIYNQREINESTISRGIKALSKDGYHPGVHRGSHKNENSSDCGFADKLPEILNVVTAEKELISERIMEIYRENQEKIPIPEELIESIASEAFNSFQDYPENLVKITGEKLIQTAQDAGASVELVKGDHQEKVAYVNLEEGTTLDTKALNKNGSQAFNLDLHSVVAQAKYLGVPENFSIPAALFLYQATERVLVENKGKKALPVEIHG